jgi:hypothetical protein
VPHLNNFMFVAIIFLYFCIKKLWTFYVEYYSNQKNAKNANKFLCELCVVNTSRNNILIYSWQMINTKINNNQHKKSNYQQMDSIKTKKNEQIYSCELWHYNRYNQ